MTVEDAGTQTCTVGTEHTLETVTGPKTCVLHVNLKNAVLGDEFEIRAYSKVLTGDSNPSLQFMGTYVHAQGDNAAPGSEAYGDVVKVSPPVAAPYSCIFTITQTAGTSRDVPWNVISM